jgi:hypothetical protein
MWVHADIGVNEGAGGCEDVVWASKENTPTPNIPSTETFSIVVHIIVGVRICQQCWTVASSINRNKLYY